MFAGDGVERLLGALEGPELWAEGEGHLALVARLATSRAAVQGLVGEAAPPSRLVDWNSYEQNLGLGQCTSKKLSQWLLLGALERLFVYIPLV